MLAYEQDLLRGPNLNEVQQQILITILLTKRKEDSDLEQSRFEQQLLIHRPDTYTEYKRSQEAAKEENLGYDQIVWGAPETAEEAAELMSLISDAHKDIDSEQEEILPEELAALQSFRGVDISQLGDEE